MRVLVCGSRNFYNWRLLERTLQVFENEHTDEGISCVIEGDASGADRLSEQWAIYNGISVERFPADWESLGKAAGPIRNGRMLTEGKPDYVIAFLAKNSVGTKNMIEQATKAGVPVKVINVD